MHMSKILTFFIFSLLYISSAMGKVSIEATPHQPSEPLTLWYTAPATNWTREALPIGNGDMGAMIMGGVEQDRVQFNHKTLWKGTSGATNLGSYLPFGDVLITPLQAQAVSNYSRSLNLRTAVANVSYQTADDTYTREYFCSYPNKVIAIRYSAKHTRSLSLCIELASAQGAHPTYTHRGASFGGTLSNGMYYAASMLVENKAGKALTTERGIVIDSAQEVVIYLSCATNFNPAASNHLAPDTTKVSTHIRHALQSASASGYDHVKQEHMADYGQLFSRTSFKLNGASNVCATNQLLTMPQTEATNMVDMLVFQYGRYLTIAASRGIDVPSNLQGIWNQDGYHEGNAVWASDIHANINVQMNYWPTEPTNLSECHMPFLNYICNEAMRPNGQWQQNAHNLGINQGWVVNTAGNIFGGSSAYKIGKYAVANAWFCSHLWQHFAYTRDTTFLRKKALPVMLSACRFWAERLVASQNGDGTLECPNEYSPEQGYVQNATAHSQQLVTQLFKQTLQALAVTGRRTAGCSKVFVKQLKQTLSKLDRGLRIDHNGLLREWKYQDNTPNVSADTDYFADDEHNIWQGHRHTSHLMALYPGFDIDPGKSKPLFNAAVKSLADRGDVTTGWARAWRISLWARARNSERAYTTLRGFAHHTTSTHYDWHGGLYDNMLDAHATSVFQIEGNYGATAGIAEMLLQSRPDSLVLLPALPREWASGHINGLKAMGNFEVSMEWESGRLRTLRIRSLKGMPLVLAYPGIERAQVVINRNNKRVSAKRRKNNCIRFDTKAGEVYSVTIER